MLSKGELPVSVWVGGREAICFASLLACTRPASLDAVPALDDIGFEGDGSWAAVQLQEEAAGVAQDRSRLIAAPKRCCARGAVLADRRRTWLSTRGCGRSSRVSHAEAIRGSWRRRHPVLRSVSLRIIINIAIMRGARGTGRCY